MFEPLKNNLEQELKIIADMHSIKTSMRGDKANKKFFKENLDAMAQQLKMLNKAVPELLKEWSPLKKFAEEEKKKSKKLKKKSKMKKVVPKLPEMKKSDKSKKTEKTPEVVEKPKVPEPSTGKSNLSLVRTQNLNAVDGKPVESKPKKSFFGFLGIGKKKSKDGKSGLLGLKYISPSTKEKKFITINKADKKEYLKKLKMSEEHFEGLKKKEKKKSSAVVIRKANLYAKYSNKYFLKYSENLAPKFTSLEKDLKRSNMPFILKTYISMALLSSVLAFFAGLLFYGLFVVSNFSNIIHIWIPFFAAGITMFGFYTYPASEASSIQKKISQELPFVTIHMAAISGSNIEPTKIFKIIAGSNEYPVIGTEMRKIISQIEIYGYDLVTALKNIAARTPNRQLSELLSGLATNISGGGELKTFLEKKAENFLLDYKLEREKYADLAGTFMDVYISILIAAPLVLMMMFIVMNVAGLGMGDLGITTLLFLSIGGIAVANIVFLVVLTLKQPAV